MIALAKPRSRMRAVTMAIALLGSACGPTVSLQIGVKERPVDVKFEGELALEATPLPAVAAQPGPSAPGTSAPGFIAAPVRLDAAVAPRPPIMGVPQADPCPAAHGEAAADQPAPAVPTGAPKEGVYHFRRSGSLTALGATSQLSPQLTRTIANSQESFDALGRLAQIRYQQIEEQPGLKTTTTYRIDLPVLTEAGEVAATGGMFIEQIVTERFLLTTAPDLAKGAAGFGDPFPGVETFTPTPPVQIADLPFAEQPGVPPRLGGGVDPLHGTAMNVRYRTIGHERIDACGEVLDAWDVEIHPDSRYINAGVRKYQFDGRFAVATQLGGLIVSEQIHFAGDDLTIPYDLRTAATINNTEPETP